MLALFPLANHVPQTSRLHVATPRVASCRASAIGATFTELAGSAGAGNVTYVLQLSNRGRATCSLPAMPNLQLLDRVGRDLPTHVDWISSTHHAPVVVRRGGSAWASARFSPDVPGPGEPTTSVCEKTAFALRIGLGGRATPVVAAIRAPTPVCEHGTMSVSALGRNRPSA